MNFKPEEHEIQDGRVVCNKHCCWLHDMDEKEYNTILQRKVKEQ